MFKNLWLMMLVSLILSGLALVSACSFTDLKTIELTPQQPALAQVEPDPDLAPDEVVRIQVEALQQNNELDQGIEITFKFASPANKRLTGPLARFKKMVKEPVYRPMLNHKLAEYGPLEISADGTVASQRVTIIERNGQATVYLFTLSKQTGPPCDGCWLTDSVVALPTHPQGLQDI